MKRKKVVLYNPMSVFFDMPLALLSVGSALDNRKYDIKIVDARVDEKPHELILKECKDAVCLGVTVLTGSPIKDALKLSRLVKEYYPALPVIWGGWHPSLFPTEILNTERSIDITVQSQGEETFRELVEILSDGEIPEKVQGISFRSGNLVKRNPPRPLKDMNDLPMVNYDLINIDKYFRFKRKRQFDYISSAGCRFRCSFCADPFVYGRAWVAYSPERISEELSYWKKKYSFIDVNFQDETFFTKRKRISELAGEFLNKKLNISWAATMRADQGYRMNDEEFEICRKSGLRRVLVGVESGSQEMMDWLKKDIKKEHVISTANKCLKHNIGAHFPFIVGFPDETEKSLKDTLKFARELRSMHPDFLTPVFYFKPYPGSDITREVAQKGYRLPQTLDEWAEFDFSASGPWVSDEKYRLIESFKFYNKLAYRRNHIILKPFEILARIRMSKNFFVFPVERYLAEIFFNSREKLN
ncbi:MAG: B12-binding domain-containing radical SAM protein [Ignavibacteria bacterium]|nr:B12-binding domain-containing radical SAM protein [Ignavibacteria bacterium]